MVFRVFVFLVGFIAILNGAKLEKVSVQFDWKHQFEYAGYIAAKEKGYYKEAQLDVELREYREGTDVVSDVLSGKATYGIHNSSIVVENGRIRPIILMATYFQHSPLVFVTQKGIKDPSHLIGKTVMMTDNERKHSALSLLLSHFDITPENSRFVDQTFSIAPFVEHKVDAMSVYRSNQLYDLDRLKIDYNIIDPAEYGFVVNAGNLFTSRQEATEHFARGKRFIDATNRGWQYAIDHPEEMITILQNRYGVKKSSAALAYEAKTIKSLMTTDLYKIGETNSEFTQRLYKQILHAGMIRENQKLGKFLFEDIPTEATNRFVLTETEENYLFRKQKITMCVDPEWYPLEAIREGKHIGIASDIMKSFEAKLAVPVELVPTKSWSESLLKVRNRQCDILAMASETADRKHYLNFTSTYLELPYVMVTTMEKPFVESIDTLQGAKIGVVRGYEIVHRLKKLYPELQIIEVESVKDGLKKVENGELYGYIDNLAVVTSYIQKEHTGSLKVSSRLVEKDELRVAVRNDEPILYGIFEKLVVQLDEATMQTCYNRWASTIEQVAWFDRAMFSKIALAIAALLAAFLWRYVLLKRYNSRLLELSMTDNLTGLYNRQKTDEILNIESHKVNRYSGYHCSVMMIDVDYFKTINDTMGHQEGDSILRKLAEVMKKSLRQSDVVGRWGGEEFIVILSHTSVNEALHVAEHLRQAVNTYPFIEAFPVTISIGVGEFKNTEEVHECIKRVDTALYRAKEEGRNSVVLA